MPNSHYKKIQISKQILKILKIKRKNIKNQGKTEIRKRKNEKKTNKKNHSD